MIDFSWSEFLQPLDPWAMLATAIIGIAVGVAVFASIGRSLHPYWLVVSGVLLFLPLSLLRALEGSMVWERLTATAILWAVYAAAMYVGSKACCRFGFRRRQ